jgi:iron complex outermembrane receptor protein
VPFFAGAPGTAPEPEEAEQIEGGFKLALPSGFSGTLAYFDITRRNVMNLLPGAPFLAVQIGEQRSRGFDMDLVWQPIPGLSMIGSYAHIDAFLVQDQLYAPGNKLDRVPADSGRFWANYRFQSAPLRNVSIGAGLYGPRDKQRRSTISISRRPSSPSMPSSHTRWSDGASRSSARISPTGATSSRSPPGTG